MSRRDAVNRQLLSGLIGVLASEGVIEDYEAGRLSGHTDADEVRELCRGLRERREGRE